MIEYTVIPMGFLINKADSTDMVLSAFQSLLLECINSFTCKKSSYHEDFLKQKAAPNDAVNTSKTYILFNTNLLEKLEHKVLSEEEQEFLVIGYYTIGLASLNCEKESISSTTKKRLRNHHYRKDGAIGCFVIGELCRSDKYTNSDIPGSEILSACIGSIKEAQDIIGGRFVLVESRKAVFDALYAPEGFSVIELTESHKLGSDPLISSALKIS